MKFLSRNAGYLCGIMAGVGVSMTVASLRGIYILMQQPDNKTTSQVIMLTLVSVIGTAISTTATSLNCCINRENEIEERLDRVEAARTFQAEEDFFSSDVLSP